MSNLLSTQRIKAGIKRLHKDERGMQSIETVVILAIAAVVVVGIFWLWDKAELGGEEGGVKGAIATLLQATFDSATGWITEWFQ